MSDGRASDGKFAKGNKLGPGNPYLKQMHALRRAMYEAVTESDIYAIVTKLIDQAKEGDVASAREVLDRTIGKPQGNDTINITADPEVANPFREYLDRNPKLADAADDLVRRMFEQPGGDGVLHDAGQVDVAQASGPVVSEAARSGDDSE